MAFMFAAAGASILSSVLGNASAKNQQTVNSMNSYIDSLKSTNAENQAIDASNTANVIRTGYKVSIQNLQTARLKQQAIQQGFDTSVKGIDALGQTQANAAASGTVGSSVDAAITDINKKQDEAQIGIDQSFATMLENAQIGIEQTVMAGQDAQQSVRAVNQIKPTNNTSDTVMSSLLAGAGTALNLYAQNSISLAKVPSSAVSTPNTSNGYSASSLLGGISSSFGSFFGG